MSTAPFAAFKKSYSPEELMSLTAAYETVCDTAGLREASPTMRAIVAGKVLDIASEGVRDPLRITDTVMYRLGLKMQHTE